jgi:hypothetical protein
MIRQTVDEEPFIQALKTRAVLPEITDGRTMIGQSHDYKRSGTTTLFEALPLPDRPASRGTSTSKASQPDTEFHGVGIIALRAENHSTIPVALREAPKASTPCNSVPYSVKLCVGLACLALNPGARSLTTRQMRLPWMGRTNWRATAVRRKLLEIVDRRLR